MKRPTGQRRTCRQPVKTDGHRTWTEGDRSASSNRMGMEGSGGRIDRALYLAAFNKLPEKSRCVLFQRILNDSVVGTRWRAPMIRLPFTALLCALASSQATAQNWVSEALLGLNEDQRNETLRTSSGTAMRNATGSSARYLSARRWSWMTGRRCAEIEIRTHLLSRRNRPQASNW
jgi:hypothetical protein